MSRATGPKAYKENLEGYYANDEDKILQSTDMEKCYFVLNLPKGKFSFFQASFRVHFMPTENVINQIDSQENSHRELFSIFLKDDKHELSSSRWIVKNLPSINSFCVITVRFFKACSIQVLKRQIPTQLYCKTPLQLQ